MSEKVKAIPEGYHAVTPYLALKDAARAIEFYKKAFGAQEKYRHNTPNGKIGHAEIKIGDSIIMLADDCGQGKGKSPAALKGTSVMLFLYVEDVDKVFNRALNAGASVVMPVTDMFWGDRHGQVMDPFGHCWSLATHKEDVTPQQLEQRMQQQMAAGKNK